MMTETAKHAGNINVAQKLRDYMMLVKPSLSIMVVFSSVICYLLATRIVAYDWQMILLFFTAGMLVTGSANAINQVVEKDTDAMMKRTAKRPIASGRMSAQEGWAFAILTGAIGIFLLGIYFNWLAASIAAFSLFMYAFIYTPLKKISAVAVLVGAIPGALPCLIGWAAGNDTLFAAGNGVRDYGGWVLFALQFFWQFPHFWAIAWIAHTDYSKAGFKLLPADEGPTKFTALQTVIYSLLLIPVGVLPKLIGMTSWAAVVIITLANLFMLWRSISLYRNMDVPSARRVMFGSYIYLPVVLFALLADKI